MTKIAQTSTIACLLSSMLKQHGSTRSSWPARHVKHIKSCQDVRSQVECGLIQWLKNNTTEMSVLTWLP